MFILVWMAENNSNVAVKMYSRLYIKTSYFDSAKDRIRNIRSSSDKCSKFATMTSWTTFRLDFESFGGFSNSGFGESGKCPFAIWSMRSLRDIVRDVAGDELPFIDIRLLRGRFRQNTFETLLLDPSTNWSEKETRRCFWRVNNLAKDASFGQRSKFFREI